MARESSKIVLGMTRVAGAVILGSCLSLTVSCGGKKSKEEAAQQQTKPTVQPRATVANGQAVLTFSQTPSQDFYCRVIRAEKIGEWYPCSSGSTTQPFDGAKAIMIEVKKGLDSTEILYSVTVDNTEAPVLAAPVAPIPGPDAAPQDPHAGQNIWKLYNPATGKIPFGGNRTFRVPPGMRLTRYSTSNGLRSLNAFNIIADDWLVAQLSRVTPCEVAGRPNANFFNIRTQVISAQSSPDSMPAQYCHYQADPRFLKEWESNEMGTDYLEVLSNPGTPIQLISAAIFSSATDAASTKRLFTEHCGVPGDYAGSRRAVNQAGYNSYFQAYNGAGRAPGFISGGTYYNLPVQVDYVAGQIGMARNQADVHWCLVDKTIPGAEGLNGSRLYIGTFEINRTGQNTADKMEFHVITQAMGQTDFEFVTQTINTSLSTLEFRLPGTL